MVVGLIVIVVVVVVVGLVVCFGGRQEQWPDVVA